MVTDFKKNTTVQKAMKNWFEANLVVIFIFSRFFFLSDKVYVDLRYLNLRKSSLKVKIYKI